MDNRTILVGIGTILCIVAVLSVGVYLERGGLEDHGVGLSPFGKAVPKAVQDKVLAAQAEMEKGVDNSFAGPVLDQSGAERIAKGQKASDKDLLTMQWFVQGVNGKLPD